MVPRCTRRNQGQLGGLCPSITEVRGTGSRTIQPDDKEVGKINPEVRLGETQMGIFVMNDFEVQEVAEKKH